MIGMLSGKLARKQPPQIVVDCGGVGYEVETPMSTFLELPPLGDTVRLHTHLQVREDAQTLYGFATEDEKLLFRTLLRVSGVGAKMALSILSAMTVGDFARCVQQENTGMLTRIPGVGRKTASCVLSYAFGVPAIAVDTHVNRISHRLGWVKVKGVDKVEKKLTRLIPQDLWLNVNRVFVQHGREICNPIRPKCYECPITSYCKFPNKTKRPS